MNTTNTETRTSTSTSTSHAEIVAMATISPANGLPSPGNDNATRGGVPDTTQLLARAEIVRAITFTLRRYRVRSRDLPDAIADVQVECIEAARAGTMPATLAQWKAFATTVATHWALDRLRQARQRGKYDAGLCEDADVYMRPTLHWEHRDPVDTKRYLAVLEELFDSGQMPEHGEDILQGEADEVPHADLAAELGVSTTVVHNRLFRMRAKFRARLAALGMLTLMLLLLGVLLSPVDEVAAPAPPPVLVVPASDGGAPPVERNRPLPSEEIAP